MSDKDEIDAMEIEQAVIAAENAHLMKVAEKPLAEAADAPASADSESPAAAQDGASGKRHAKTGTVENKAGTDLEAKPERKKRKSSKQDQTVETPGPAPAKKPRKKAANENSKPKKANKKTVSKETVQEKIADYFQLQQRPYNSTKVYENLLKVFPHPLVKSALAELVKAGVLDMKEEGRTSLFWVLQTQSSENAEQINRARGELAKEIEERESQLEEKRVMLKNCVAETKALAKEPTDHELDICIQEAAKLAKEAKQSLSDMKERVSGAQLPLDHLSLKEAQAAYKFYRAVYLERKRNVMDVIRTISEQGSQTIFSVMDEAGIEPDPSTFAV